MDEDKAQIKLANLRKRWSGLSDEQYQTIMKYKCMPLWPAVQMQALELYGKGYSQEEVCRYLKTSRYTLACTTATFPDFKKKWKAIHASRTSKVESVLYRYATGSIKQVKTWTVAVVDEDGKPVKDKNGKQVYRPVRQEITKLPPPPALLIFYLQSLLPDVYGKSKQAEPTTDDMIPEEAIRLKLSKIKAA